MGDSNPGNISTSIGGVGFNVALAHLYALQSRKSNHKSRFVSAVGSDLVGDNILKQLDRYSIDKDGVTILPGHKSAQYVAHMDEKGHLMLATADMKIIESEEFSKHVGEQIERTIPKIIVVDCNLLAQGLDVVFEAAAALKSKPRVIVEPTSAPKLRRMVHVNSGKLKIFPNNIILLITPTVEELGHIHDSFAKREFFDDYDSWFPLLDLLGIDSQFREKMSSMALKNKAMKTILEEGVVQRAVQLLPYIPNILVKLGPQGCVFVSLNTNVEDYKSVPTTSRFRPSFTLISRGRTYEEGKTLGVTIEHFDVPSENGNLKIVNVNGAGDTLLGYLASLLVQTDWLTNGIELLEQEWGKWEGIYKAQIASGKTIESESAVSEKITEIE